MDPKNILKRIWKWISSNWKNPVIIILIIFCMVTCVRSKRMEKRYEGTIEIVSDSITEYKNKIGELYSERKVMIADLDRLENGNKELLSEVNNLKDHPIVVTKVVTNTVIEPIAVHDTVTKEPDGRYSFSISYDDPWCVIRGKSMFDMKEMAGEASFDTIMLPDSLWIDLIDHKGELSFIARSSNPYVKINNLNGAVLSPEKSKAFRDRFDRKWVLSVGVGGTVTWIDDRFRVVPGVQLTFGRKILSF